MSVENHIQEELKASLLFVDDEKNILSSLKRLFRSEGYNIFLANSGEEGLDLLASEKIDLVISDMRMPEMNGAEFLELVSTKWPKVIRILLTGYSEISATIDAVNKGKIYQYISKPWEDNDIKLTVRHALEIQEIEKERDRLLVLTKQQNKSLREFNANLEDLVKKRTAELDQTVGMVESAYATLKENYSTTIRVFSDFIEMREGSLKGQSKKISEQAGLFISSLGIDDDYAQQVSFAAMLRNIGKIGFSDRLFNMPVDSMSEDDKAEYQKHPVIGSGILMSIEPLKTAAKIIHGYRERYDGKGFPDGLKGDEIPLGSQVLSVVSDYYALQSGGLVLDRLSAKNAGDYIARYKGIIYSPKIVEKFINYLNDTCDIEKTEFKEKKVAVKDLVSSMVLSKDVTTKDGFMLLSKGHKIGDHVIMHLLKLEKSLNEVFDVYVRV